MEKEKRVVKKSFRFTQSEWHQIEKKCSFANITATQYFQKLAVSGKTAKNDCVKEKQKYIEEIAMVGNNINQIARQLNSGKKLDMWMLNILLKIEQTLNDRWLF